MSFFGKSFKGIIDLAVIPIEVVKDITTFGGIITNKPGGSYTGDRIKSALDNFSDAYDEID